MTDREKLYRGAGYAAWGYVFLYLNFNLGTLNILPDFVGYLLHLSAIRLLGEERRDMALLRPLGIALALFNFLDWLMTLLGAGLDGRWLFLNLLVGAASMYFQFQFITDCAALAEHYQEEGDNLDRCLLCWRTVQTLLTTAVVLLGYGGRWLGESVRTAVLVGLAFLGVVTGLCLTVSMFALRRIFWTDNMPEQQV